MTQRQQRPRWKLRYLFAALWVLTSLSLIGWWVYFGFEQIERLESLGYPNTDSLVSYQKMLLWEGAFLLLLLIGGGAALAYYMYSEIKQSQRVRDFFLTFTHETKTVLASVQLQGELLEERLNQPADQELLRGLLADIGKLSTQVENSLLISQVDSQALHPEEFAISELIERLRIRFPALTLVGNCKALIRSDRTAMESIFANLFQNALVHGRATEMQICCAAVPGGLIRVELQDNGVGLKGDRSQLGQRFSRLYSKSGSGLGLSIVKGLLHRLGGELSFPEASRGFAVTFTIAGRMPS